MHIYLTNELSLLWLLVVVDVRFTESAATTGWSNGGGWWFILLSMDKEISTFV